MDITKTTNIRAIIKTAPATREVFDKYGLLECGGPMGPSEPLGFFARTHNVEIETLIEELKVRMSENDG